MSEGSVVSIISKRELQLVLHKKYEQDSIAFEWYKYSLYLKKSLFKKTPFHLPCINDGTAVVAPKAVHMHMLCTRGIATVLDWGKKRWWSIRMASTKMSVMPMHKKTGKQAPHAIDQDQSKYKPPMRYFEYLLNLREVRAMRVIQTWWRQ